MNHTVVGHLRFSEPIEPGVETDVEFGAEIGVSYELIGEANPTTVPMLGSLTAIRAHVGRVVDQLSRYL